MKKAVFFDVDGVLVDSFEVNFAFYCDLMAKYGYPAPTRQTYSTMFNLPLNEVIRKITGADESRVQEMWEASRRGEIPYKQELMKVPMGMGEIVESLSRAYMLGVVTSRIRGSLFMHPKIAELETYFKTAIYFEDTKNHKPHPEPLLLAAQRLNVEATDSVYIGDADTDIQAAKAAGMKMILFSATGHGGADAYTQSFEELPELVASLLA